MIFWPNFWCDVTWCETAIWYQIRIPLETRVTRVWDCQKSIIIPIMQFCFIIFFFVLISFNFKESFHANDHAYIFKGLHQFAYNKMDNQMSAFIVESFRNFVTKGLLIHINPGKEIITESNLGLNFSYLYIRMPY